MFKKKQLVKEEAPATQKSPKPAKAARKKAGKSITAWAFQPILIIACLGVVSYILIEGLALKALEDKNKAQLIEQLSSTAQNEINQYVKHIKRALSAVAKDPSSNKKKIETLSVVFPELKEVYALEADELLDVQSRYPSMSFASLDLLRRSAKSSTTLIEAFFNEEWFFHIAVPQKTFATDGSVESVVYMLAVFDSSEIKQILMTSPVIDAGSFELLTLQEKTVIARGEGNPNNAQTMSLLVPQWKVRFALSDTYHLQADRQLLMGVLGAISVVGMIFVFLIIRLNMASLRKDIQSVAAYISRISSGAKAKKELRYSELVILSDAISDRIKVLKDAVKNVPKGDAKADNSGAKSGSKASEKSVASKGKVEPSDAMDDDAPLFDEDLLDLDELAEGEDFSDPHTVDDEGPMVAEVESLADKISAGIFRAYDIRGIVDESLNPTVVELIGKAIASEAIAQGQHKLCVGFDGRHSSIEYCQALSRGITSCGVDVIIVGQVPTPVLYFATHHFETGSGVMITGSHNPSNYNGFKIMLAGKTLSGEEIQRLYNRIVIQDFAVGNGSIVEQSVETEYMDTILNDIAVAAPLKVVVDAGNGVAGSIAPNLIEELGCEVIPLYCDVDGNFPNHHPDPGKPENLADLIEAVKSHGADLGVAFDGDGDRVGVVTNTGKIIWPDRLLMLFAKDVVSRNPGADILFDVKCSRRLNGLISSYGGRPVMWKTGHSLMKAKMKETGALLAGEMSGHIFFKERWFGFDDGVYSAVRLLEILGIEDRTTDEVFADFPEDVSTPEINVPVTDENKFELVERLCAMKAQFEGGNVSTIDGLRVDYPNGWGLCRASNTTPVLVLRFEADDADALEEIKQKFKTQLSAIDSSIPLDF